MPTRIVKSKPLLARAAGENKKPLAPVWDGPCGAGPQGGITQSLIGRWLVCRERFRLLVMEGWKPQEKFSAPLDFGNLWHVAEEHHAKGTDWAAAVEKAGIALVKRFPLQAEEISLWYQKCTALFPFYVEHWSEHPDVLARKPLLQEEPFDVPYLLPSGRKVRLRGKWDSVDLIGDGKEAGIWIQENKTKSQIDRKKIVQQVGFDLQSMLYVIALRCSDCFLELDYVSDDQIKGVRYNVIRRAAHKSAESMVKKFEEDRDDRRTAEWFDRWNVEIGADAVVRFKNTCLDPILENVCDDYEWWQFCREHRVEPWDDQTRLRELPQHRSRHFRMPFGVYNPLTESGGGTDLDALMDSGSTFGLHRTNDLFPELK